MTDVEKLAENLFRLAEFRHWVVQGNSLFPEVPDSLVHPMRDHIRACEHKLIAKLYDMGEFERVAQVERSLRKRVPA